MSVKPDRCDNETQRSQKRSCQSFVTGEIAPIRIDSNDKVFGDEGHRVSRNSREGGAAVGGTHKGCPYGGMAR